MSCWVTPPIAAEYWRVSLEHVLGRIREGTVRTRVENGFTFVDVLPEYATAALMPPVPNAPPPATYVMVSRDELAALGADVPTTPDAEPSNDGLGDDRLEHTVDPEEYTPDQQGALPLISWSSARTRAARTRIAPRRLAA